MYSKLDMHLLTKKKLRKMYRIQNKNELEQSLETNVKMNEVKYFLYQKHFIFCMYLRFIYLSVHSTTSTLLIHWIQMCSKPSTCFHISMHIAQSNCLSSANSILIVLNFCQFFSSAIQKSRKNYNYLG